MDARDMQGMVEIREQIQIAYGKIKEIDWECLTAEEIASLGNAEEIVYCVLSAVSDRLDAARKVSP